jgi:hypothetical protein
MRMAAWLSACPPSSALRVGGGLLDMVGMAEAGQVGVGVAVAAFAERYDVVDLSGQ